MQRWQMRERERLHAHRCVTGMGINRRRHVSIRRGGRRRGSVGAEVPHGRRNDLGWRARVHNWWARRGRHGRHRVRAGRLLEGGWRLVVLWHVGISHGFVRRVLRRQGTLEVGRLRMGEHALRAVAARGEVSARN